jgi:hypothetical protein
MHVLVMKLFKGSSLLIIAVLTTLLSSCGPTYVGTRAGYGYGPGYYDARPNYGYRPYGYYRRPPVIVQRRTYVTPAPRYRSSPGARYGNGGNYSNRSYGARGRSSRGPR